MDYDKFEKEIIEDYLRHVVEISCSLEEKLEKAGVDTLGVYEFAKYLEWELLEHFNANKKNVFGRIAEKISGKKKESDINIIKEKASGYFGGKMKISGKKYREAAYLDEKGAVEVSVPYICQIATGSGRDVVFHELRHAEKSIYSQHFSLKVMRSIAQQKCFLRRQAASVNCWRTMCQLNQT